MEIEKKAAQGGDESNFWAVRSKTNWFRNTLQSKHLLSAVSCVFLNQPHLLPPLLWCFGEDGEPVPHTATMGVRMALLSLDQHGSTNTLPIPQDCFYPRCEAFLQWGALRGGLQHGEYFHVTALYQSPGWLSSLANLIIFMKNAMQCQKQWDAGILYLK